MGFWAKNLCRLNLELVIDSELWRVDNLISFSMNEVLEEPDIMGDLRDAVECFYKRDHVEIVEETRLTEQLFFTDINFTHKSRVTQVCLGAYIFLFFKVPSLII